MPLSTKSFLDMLDDFLSQSKPLTVNSEKYILKTYSKEVGILKWFAISAASWIINAYPYTSSPIERMKREIGFLKSDIKGVNKPRLYIIDWSSNAIIREYVEGETIDPVVKSVHGDVAAVIARIHNHGIILGDTKYFNFLKTRSGEIYIIDAEQAIKSGNTQYMAWDIVVYLITIMYKLINISTIHKPRRYREYIEYFLEEYMSEKKDYMEVFRMFKKLNIGNTIALLVPPPFNAYLLKTLLDASNY